MMGLCQNDVLRCAVVVLLCGHVFSKECTNIPIPLQSHTLRYEFEVSKNETWKQEILANNHHDHHLIPTDDSTWASLFPRKMLREQSELSWNVVYRKFKHPGQIKLEGNFRKEVSLHDVRLDPESVHGLAQQTNLEYLLMLDVDRLLWSFRKTAGLPMVGSPYGGWEAPDIELRGHFVGHYLSATAHMWASTHNQALKEKMTTLVSALKECQDKMGTGYLSAFPSELFDRVEAIQPVWAPYYTIHKVMAGLLDQHTLAGNPQALGMLKWMVEYFYNRVQNVIRTYTIERHWMSLNEEFGGMNDILYRLFSITGDPKHLLLAHLFDKPCFLGLLAIQADDLSGFHANTHIPVVVGAQMRYELTGDELYKEIGITFMDMINSSHSFATGGTSASEFWENPKWMGTYLHTETEESCTTYNMLKVSRNLFRWTKEVIYADYYERALTNGVLGIQKGTEPGVMIYMLGGPHLIPSGAAMAQLADSIYFEEGGSHPALYVIQYISSSLDWKSGNIILNQKVDKVVSWDQHLRVALTVTECHGARTSTLNLRIPSWASSGTVVAHLNEEALNLPSPDDRPDYGSLYAIIYGPYVLAGLSLGDHEITTGSAKSVSDWVTPVPADYNSHLISLSQETGNSRVFFSNKDQIIVMAPTPEAGNHSAVHATFRLILSQSMPSSSPSSEEFSSLGDVIGKSVMLEPFDFPGMVVSHSGTDKGLFIGKKDSATEFHVVKGLGGEDGTVSLESKSEKGCFVYSGQEVTLSCGSGSSKNAGFAKGASFVLEKGLREYHPISFVAKGETRSYVLEPIMNMRDEFYNVYFHISN
ncbi:hypothetical protein AKJ16_DCAP13215 [Drosera capensis]